VIDLQRYLSCYHSVTATHTADPAVCTISLVALPEKPTKLVFDKDGMAPSAKGGV
jgi:hypothetical protein